MTRKRPQSVALPNLDRGFETSRQSAAYLIMAFEQASPTLRRRASSTATPDINQSSEQMNFSAKHSRLRG
jgi:hypothetical protein